MTILKVALKLAFPNGFCIWILRIFVSGIKREDGSARFQDTKHFGCNLFSNFVTQNGEKYRKLQKKIERSISIGKLRRIRTLKSARWKFLLSFVRTGFNNIRPMHLFLCGAQTDKIFQNSSAPAAHFKNGVI